jgi:uncharacterized membrane protein YuzA (DUF378 family)
MAIGKLYKQHSILFICKAIYGLILLIAVVSFIPTMSFFIKRRTSSHHDDFSPIWPWTLLILNIFRDSSIYILATVNFVFTLTTISQNVNGWTSITSNFLRIFYPIIDLSTGLSILYLYHRLGTEKIKTEEL